MKQEKKLIPDAVVDTIEIKGVKYSVYEGQKGGRYYYNTKKKKVYLPKTEVKKPKIKKVEEVIYVGGPLKKYVGYFTVRKDGELIDDYKEWCSAHSEAEAREYFEKDINSDSITLDMIVEES